MPRRNRLPGPPATGLPLRPLLRCREAFALLSASHPLMPSQLMGDIRKKDSVAGLKEKQRRDPRGVITFQVRPPGLHLLPHIHSLDGCSVGGCSVRECRRRGGAGIQYLFGWLTDDDAGWLAPAATAGMPCLPCPAVHACRTMLPLPPLRSVWFWHATPLIQPPSALQPYVHALCSGASSRTRRAATAWSWSTGSSATETPRGASPPQRPGTMHSPSTTKRWDCRGLAGWPSRAPTRQTGSSECLAWLAGWLADCASQQAQHVPSCLSAAIAATPLPRRPPYRLYRRPPSCGTTTRSTRA